jgi:hypothetical protein
MENTSYSQKLHIPASPSDQESLTINSGQHATTLSLKYMQQPGIPYSLLPSNPTPNIQFLLIPAYSGIRNITCMAK